MFCLYRPKPIFRNNKTFGDCKFKFQKKQNQQQKNWQINGKGNYLAISSLQPKRYDVFASLMNKQNISKTYAWIRIRYFLKFEPEIWNCKTGQTIVQKLD